jgi:hypothetical protein
MTSSLTLFYIVAAALAAAQPQKEPGLLFYLSGDRGLTADYAAGGNPAPNFANDQVKTLPGGARGAYLQCGDHEVLSYWAPGNIYAQRGTLSFYWRSREPVGKTEFPVFRVGHGDHSSWDMVWLRIDYNGKPGFDAFVTDVNLGRTRVSTAMPAFPKPDEWAHLALSWDETARTPAASARCRSKALTTSTAAATSTRSGSTTGCFPTTTSLRWPAARHRRTFRR